MLVYRVEDETRIGPYRSRDHDSDKDCLANALCIAHSSSQHPSPSVDFDFWMESDFVCAFTSLDALLRWFDGFLERLSKLGYSISVYDIPDKYVVGGTTETQQCVFNAKLNGGYEVVDTIEPIEAPRCN